VGFLIGLYVTTIYVNPNPPWLIYGIAIGTGAIGAILALFLQHLAIALVGFIAGGYGAFYLSQLLGYNTQTVNWMAFIIGGIVGLLLVASAFNWALYLTSAWAGATLITEAIGLQAQLGLVLFFVLFVLGMVIQAGLFRNEPKKKPVEVIPEPQQENKDEK
jgi:peptidoglycan biosynthesis protein MviN/MurJ (putative lipid II flippase)